MPLHDIPVLLREQHNHIVRLTLNRPEVLNAFNRELLLALQAELAAINADPAVRAVIITGSGDRAFSAGADIAFLNQAAPLEVRELARLAIAVTRMIEELDAVTLALVNGYALGGGLEIAEACTLRIAVSGAKMGHPEVRIGAVAGWGGTTRLPRLIGRGRAAELLLTGRMIDADQALEWGLVNRVVPAQELDKAGQALLEEILANAPAAVALSREAVHRGMDLCVDESTRLGADLFGLSATTEDFRTGTRAFLDKQQPDFTGR